MARLGDHPHLMPVFDMGLENGLPFLVQPFMAGGDVEGLLEEAKGEDLVRSGQGGRGAGRWG